jgi:hypothetical protein
MSATILEFPLNKISSTDKSFYDSDLVVKKVSDYTLSNASSIEYSSFEKILSDRKLSKEMFTPDYFMLVE